MYLIGDGGKTKVNRFFGNSLEDGTFFTSDGFSPSSTRISDIRMILDSQVLPSVNPDDITDIIYYGAGCRPENLEMQSLFYEMFGDAITLILDNDVVGAGISGYGPGKGIITILGTGSNCAMYNDGEIIHRIGGHGYIIGDEGSGVDLGKRLINAYCYEQLPNYIGSEIEENLGINGKKDLKKKIYMQSLYVNNTWYKLFSGLTKIIYENRENEIIEKIIMASFHEFFEKNIMYYQKSSKSDIVIIGSIGYLFQDNIMSVAHSFDIQSIKFIRYPLHEIVKYYTNN